jgi:hypothetical protein
LAETTRRVYLAHGDGPNHLNRIRGGGLPKLCVLFGGILFFFRVVGVVLILVLSV